MRHPLTVLGLGPAYLFLLHQRLPVGLMRAGWQPWLSVMGTNLAIALVVGLLVCPPRLAGLPHGPGADHALAGAIGVWLFYVQHQFEHTYWARDAEWDSRDGALHGSSHYDLPPVLRWFTANIGLHHVHHLSSRIPCYRRPLSPDARSLAAVKLLAPISNRR
jgi:acyl-lipid omega-6 desaturase (Delta-12 desaturase)